jgi:type IV pilus assembly protein PilV
MPPLLNAQCHIPSSPACNPTLAAARASGFTLIEVLVTLLVLAIGILGIASLQMQGLRGTHEALLHTQAGTLAVDMSERLLAHTTADGPLDAQDLQDWKAQLAQRLPEGDGSVTVESTAITVNVLWNEHGAPQHYVLSFMP